MFLPFQVSTGKPQPKGDAGADVVALRKLVDLARARALLVRWSKEAENHLALLQLASGLIAFRKAHAARLVAALQG